MSTYRRLLGFLRPHAGRFAGNIAANVVGAALDGIAFLLLIPFLNTLFNQPQAIPTGRGWLTHLLDAVVGALIGFRFTGSVLEHGDALREHRDYRATCT